MKDCQFDATLVAAASAGEHTNTFVKETMKQIKRTSPAAQAANVPKLGFFQQLLRYHKPAAVVLALVALVLVGSAVYAAVHFAPAFIQMLGKETNQRGATEYSVAGFKDCSTHNPSATERFEVKKGVQLTDDEAQKIIQAKCELSWLEDFPGKKWPTYGTNAVWKDGDTIYYTRLDMLGTYKGGDEAHATVDLAGNITDFTPPQGEKITAFAAGEEIALSDIKPGDTVFTVSRISEVYHDLSKYGGDKEKNVTTLAPPQEQPKALGVVALFKMSLPQEYYLQKQQYVTEIPSCAGNTDELCANTPSIDVYPRAGGEGASNPYHQDIKDGVYHEITGTVTALNDDTLTLTSRKGNTYTVTVGDAGFKAYNRDYTAAYNDVDAVLKIGSNVAVRYIQVPGANPKTITKEQVQMVVLQLESLNIKQGPITQY